MGGGKGRGYVLGQTPSTSGIQSLNGGIAAKDLLRFCVCVRVRTGMRVCVRV